MDAIKQKRWRDLPNLTPRQRALCEVAEKMTLYPTRMTTEDWQPLRDLGFDDQALLETGHVIALFNYYPRMADGFGLTPDPQVKAAGETGVALKRV